MTKKASYDVRSNEYHSWSAMRVRCHNKNTAYYRRYGGRGITICERWNSFENFLSDMGPRPIGASLDRINNNGNYAPDNCRWSSSKVQNRNKSSNLLITHDGQTKSVSEWAEFLNVKRTTMFQRVRYGWDIERMLFEPVKSIVPSTHVKLKEMYSRYKLKQAEREILEQLEFWARKYAASLHSSTLDNLLEELDKIRKEARKNESHL